MSNSTKKWYALYTRQGCEKRVATYLTRRNIENYCPMQRSLNGKNKVSQELLFPSFIFVRIRESELMPTSMIDNVINFVYWLGTPAVIQDEEIEILKSFMNEYINVTVEKIPFNVEGMVRVFGGPAAENKLRVTSYKNNMVKILLPSLGYILYAEAEKSNVEIITSTKKTFTLLDKYQYAIQKYQVNSASKI